MSDQDATTHAQDDGLADFVGDCCLTCNGKSGTISGEMQGDGYMTGWVEFYESCGNCVDRKRCPGCMAPAPTIDAENIDEFTCDVCGWHYENDRFYPADLIDYDDSDYPDFERYETDHDYNDTPLDH